MSTLNVDNINEYTTDGKVNVGHDIKLASGKSVLNSDSQAIGNLVKVGSVTASDSATVSIDNFVDTTNYSLYKIVAHNLLPSVDDREIRLKFRSGGASGSDITGTYYRAGHYAYASTSGSGTNANSSYTDYGTFTGGVGSNAGEGLSFTGIISVANGSTGTNWIEMSWVYKNSSNHLVKDNETISIKETTAMTGIKFYFNSGNVASGTIDIYGFAK